MRLEEAFDLVKEAGNRWLDDKCYRLGASLSYYAIFSVFPLLLLAVTGVGFLLGEGPEARGRVLAAFDASGPEIRALLDQTLKNMQEQKTARGVGAVIGVVTLIFGASGVFGELDTALNVIWRCPEPKTEGVVEAVKVAVKGKATSFGLVLGAAVLVLGSLATSTAIGAISTSAARVVSIPWAWQLVELGVSAAFLSVVFAAIFRVVPACPIPWRDVLPAAVFTTVLFSALKRLLAYYLAHLGGYGAYGAVGAVLAMLTWIYVLSLLVFFGAELSRVYAERFGSRRGSAPHRASDDVHDRGGDPDHGARPHALPERPVGGERRDEKRGERSTPRSAPREA